MTETENSFGFHPKIGKMAFSTEKWSIFRIFLIFSAEGAEIQQFGKFRFRPKRENALSVALYLYGQFDSFVFFIQELFYSENNHTARTRFNFTAIAKKDKIAPCLYFRKKYRGWHIKAWEEFIRRHLHVLLY